MADGINTSWECQFLYMVLQKLYWLGDQATWFSISCLLVLAASARWCMWQDGWAGHAQRARLGEGRGSSRLTFL